MWIYLAAAAAAGVALLIILVVLRVRKKRRMGVQPKNNIVVKNGVDVYHQVIGSTKGDHFLEGISKNGTVFIKGKKKQKNLNRICLRNINTGAQYMFDFREYLYIGRKANDGQYHKLVLENDAKVSGTHCVIYGGGGVFYLKDLQSKNHTYLNGRMVTGDVKLTTGDCIHIGNTSLGVYF